MSSDPQSNYPPDKPQPHVDPYAVPPPQDGTQPYNPTPNSAYAGTVDKDSSNMAMLAHLLGIFLGFIGPLIIWLMKKDESPFVNDQGKEALNFHITLIIMYVVISPITVITCGFGGVLYAVPAILQLVCGIMGSIEASKGNYYRYPLTIRMIS